MAADLHIHVFEGIEESDLRNFFRNTLGSKYFSPRPVGGYEGFSAAYDTIVNTPSVWVGEVSWLKAALFEDGEETFVPSPVQKIHELIGENLPVLDDKLEREILDALGLENVTSYEVESVVKIHQFLRSHKGKQLFTVSW